MMFIFLSYSETHKKSQPDSGWPFY